MISLQTEKGKETYEDLLSLLKGHPEIDEACLMYTINRDYRITQYDGTTFYIYGNIVDWEYSFVGSRADDEDENVDALARFAEGYGVWDEADLFLEGTSLIGSKDGYDPDANEYPDCDWPAGNEAYGLVMDSVELPSGKEVELP